MKQENLVICHECDLLVTLEPLAEGYKAACPRCACVFTRRHPDAINRLLIFSLSAAICLVFSNMFDFVEMGIQGQERALGFFETVQELFAIREWAIGSFVLAVIIGLPVLFVGMVCGIALSLKFNIATLTTFELLRAVEFLRFWNMAEIFFLGILISMVKIAALAEMSLGPSFWIYALFNLFFVLTLLHFDKFQLALVIRQQIHARSAADNRLVTPS